MSEGKKITTSINNSFEWLNLSDSHGSLMGPYLCKNGVNNVAVSGGLFEHLHRYVIRENFFKKNISAVILLAGGNDLAMGNRTPENIASQLMEFIKQFSMRRPKCIVITGTVIPRASQWDYSWGDNFIKKIQVLDGCMKQVTGTHHHWLSDVFIDEPVGFDGPRDSKNSDHLHSFHDPVYKGQETWGKVNPKLDLYGSDFTHLNQKGRGILEEIYSFIFDSLVGGEFWGARALTSPEVSPRRVFWKF